MSQVIINDGDSGLVTRNAINNNFTELYNSIIMPAKLSNLNANSTFAVAPNSFIKSIAMTLIDGSPTIRIGTAPNGTDIQPDIEVTNFNENVLQQYFSSTATLYITFTQPGTVSFRIEILNNYF